MMVIIGLAAITLLLVRPTSQPQIMYVPVEVPTTQQGGLGCLPMIIVVIMVLLILGVIQF